jgi:FlaA1/EpsC-like NDP-sugar epimerase
MVVADAILINAAALLTLTLPLNGDLEVSPASLVFVIARIVAIRLLCHWYFGLYNRVWEYASINELISIIKAVTVGSLISLLFMVNFLPASLQCL